MPRISWILPDDSQCSAEIPAGYSLMEAALSAGVPGIAGACGGFLTCATCHVVVPPDWRAATGAASPEEEAMLSVADVPPGPGSRLSCQIAVTERMDGLVLRLPRR